MYKVKTVLNLLINKYRTCPIGIKAAFGFFACSVLQKCISVITTPIFTRLMSTGEYGEYSVFTSWQGIITAFTILTLPWGVYTQGLVKNERTKDEFTSVLIGLMTSLCVLWIVIYFCGKSFWNNCFSLSTFMMILMFFVIWSSSIIDFWSMRQRIEYKYKSLVVITLAISLLNPTVGILLITFFNDKAVGRIFAITVVQFIFAAIICVRLVAKGKKIYDRSIWKYALVYNLQLVPHYLSQQVLNSADRIMISRMANTDSAGIYSLAYSLSLLMTMVNTALLQAISPWVYQRIKSKNVELLPRIGYPSLAVVAGCNILLIAFAPEIVGVFAPEPYFDAIWIIPPVAMSTFFIYMYGLFANFEFYYEKTKYISIATLTGAVVNIILNYIFIKMCGYYAAGYTTLVCYILYTIFHYKVMCKICKNDDKLKKAPYEGKVLIYISLIFILVGSIITITYRHFIARYTLILICVISALIRRKDLIELLKCIISIRGEGID